MSKKIFCMWGKGFYILTWPINGKTAGSFLTLGSFLTPWAIIMFSNSEWCTSGGLLVKSEAALLRYVILVKNCLYFHCTYLIGVCNQMIMSVPLIFILKTCKSTLDTTLPDVQTSFDRFVSMEIWKIFQKNLNLLINRC